MKKIVEGIETRAKKNGMTMAQLCKEADVNYTTYWRWKQGGGLNLRSLLKLEEVLNKTP